MTKVISQYRKISPKKACGLSTKYSKSDDDEDHKAT